jgi:hypothetical protein
MIRPAGGNKSQRAPKIIRRRPAGRTKGHDEAKQKGNVMKNARSLAVALLALAALGGCASVPTAQRAQAAADTPQVSRPAATYGTMGGYRYRRLVAVTAPAS